MTTPHIDHYAGCSRAPETEQVYVMTAEGSQPYKTPPDIPDLPPVARYQKPQSGPELQRRQSRDFTAIVGSLASGRVCRPPVGNEALEQPWRTPPATFPTAEQLEYADWR